MRILSAGESHGRRLSVIIEGFPGGVRIDPSFFLGELSRRKVGYGRGGRMSIEQERLEFTAGVRFGETTGAPVCMSIDNDDFINWEDIMAPFAEPSSRAEVRCPRPGHADLSGVIKYRRHDARDILERASARETAMRVAAGALCKSLLMHCGMQVYSVVWSIGGAGTPVEKGLLRLLQKQVSIAELHAIAETNDLRMADRSRLARVRRHIDAARNSGDTLGGLMTVGVTGVPPGLGSHISGDRRLDAILCQAVMSIPAVKMVAVGGGMICHECPGSGFHDELTLSKKHGVMRPTNMAGGIEGGISNGEDVIVTAAMKPIPTLKKPLRSFNLSTGKAVIASYERSDVTAVPACAVVAEAMVAQAMTEQLMQKFGCDTLDDIIGSLTAYSASCRSLWKRSF